MTKILLAAAAVLLTSCQMPLRNAAAESITTNLFDTRGNRIGQATQTGNTTTFYDARGNKIGSSTMTGNTTNFYDARGNRTRSTTSAPATKR
jgi:YD repeat-containing protein